MVIARHYRNFKKKQHLLSHKLKIRISLPLESVPIQLIGSFTEPPWGFLQCFHYSLTTKDLFVTVWLRPGDTFQLRKRDEVKLHPDFPVVLVRSKQLKDLGLANVFMSHCSGLSRIPLRNREKGLVFDSGVFSQGKVRGRNEDAFFQAAKSLGVSDGVSAWWMHGIDGGQFARELMRNCRDISLSANSHKELAAGLSEAHSKMQAYGSSTVLLGFLVDSHLLLSVLGDSSAIVVRWTSGSPAIILKTEVLVHCFNTPYQLAHIPKRLNHRSFIRDMAADALQYSLDIVPGDMLIMGTDGFWDNIYECDLIHILRSEERLSTQGVADRLGNQASQNSKLQGPFAHQVYLGAQGSGGKTDDITVLATLIVDLI